ncbi:hypothetical protein [Streptomyces sp. NPDC059010]|uniref:hypothetical protein n=1 Tax=Streptomyces sp. NPDC059010 TaxID=3346695 RepID=UPI003686EFA2
MGLTEPLETGECVQAVTPCLVLGRHAATGGEVGRFRDDGENLWVGQMSVGDCWVYVEQMERTEQEDGYNAPLIDCAKPHTDQVMGTVQAPGEMSHKNGSDNAAKLCGNKFESVWAPGPERHGLWPDLGRGGRELGTGPEIPAPGQV